MSTKKKPYEKPVLTKYGSLKDVYKGPSCLGDLLDICA
jgi:hypothetical protein